MPASRNNGVSLSVAKATMARAPSLTPKALSAIRIAYSTTSVAVRRPGVAIAGTTLPIWSTSAAEIPALEATLVIHISAPATKPAKVPKAAAV